MTKSKRRQFSKEFKESIVKIITDDQRPVAEVCRDHKLTQSMVYGWLKQKRIATGQRDSGELTSQDRAEIVQLQRRLKDVEMENSFL